MWSQAWKRVPAIAGWTSNTVVSVFKQKTTVWPTCCTAEWWWHKNSFSSFKEQEHSSSQWQLHFSTLKSSTNKSSSISFWAYASAWNKNLFSFLKRQTLWKMGSIIQIPIHQLSRLRKRMTWYNFFYRKSNAMYFYLHVYIHIYTLKNHQKETVLKGPEKVHLTTTLHCFLPLLKFITCLLHI